MPRSKALTETDFFPITESLLKKLAGKAAYEKGVDYFNKDAVGELDVSGSKIIAEVQGLDIYRVALNHNQRELSGACDCPASDGIDFCKHCVAVALVRARELADEKEIKNKPAKKLSEPEKRRAALQDYFHAMDKETLIAQLIDMIENDKILRKEWQLKLQKTRSLSATELQKLINSSIPLNKHLYRGSELSRYFESVDSLINFLAEKLDFADKQTLPLLEHTLERFTQAVETMDDSGGYRLDCETHLTNLYMSALAKAPFTPDQLAHYVFNLWGKSYNDLLPNIPADFEHLFNEHTKIIFLELVESAWEAATPPKKDQWNFSGYDYHRTQLEAVLLDGAYSQNNFERIIYIKSKFANSAKDYLILVDICLEFKQTTLARDWLKKARAIKTNQYSLDSVLEQAEVKILLQEKNPHSAIDILWMCYQKTPNFSLLNQITGLASSLTPVKNWEAEAIVFHRNKLNGGVKDYDKLLHANHLVALLLQHKQYEETLVVCNAHKVDTKLLLTTAKYFGQQPDKSVPLVSRVIYAILQQANLNNQNYKDVVELLKRIHTYANSGAKPEMFTQFLTAIRATYKAKRNLMAYIQEAFGS